MHDDATFDPAWEFALDPAAFADGAPVLDLNDPAVAARLRAELRETAYRCGQYWGEVRRRSMELARQTFIP